MFWHHKANVKMWIFFTAFALLFSAVFSAIYDVRYMRNNRYEDSHSSPSGTCQVDETYEWSYRGSNGPPFWRNNFNTCAGRSQSPIAIDSKSVVDNNDLRELDLYNYEIPITTARVENNGRTVEIFPMDRAMRAIKIDGVMYNLTQCHFHFGCKKGQGSEHVIDEKQYEMELHCVNVNAGSGRIAVIALLLREKLRANIELEKFVQYLRYIQYRDEESEVPLNLNLRTLLLRNGDGTYLDNLGSYYRYQGSLTTPACNETVTWTVLKGISTVGHKQLDQFRKLYTVQETEANPNCKMCDNYRPTQPINERQVSYYRSMFS